MGKVNLQLEVPCQDFWLAVRRNLGINDRGDGRCEEWTRQAISLLEKEIRPESKGFTVNNGIALAHGGFGLFTHYWLQKQTTKGVYIADGTAGQFSRDHPEGFYAILNDAPFSLRRFYMQG